MKMIGCRDTLHSLISMFFFLDIGDRDDENILLGRQVERW